VRGSPSLVWGRPAKSVVERPRGFESHTPRHRVNTLLFENYLKQHVREVTAKTYFKRMRILSKLEDLDDTEKMKTLIFTYSYTESFKEFLANAYDYYVR
jgi:hypothetical protein